jgi:prepilin-type N-terminal cleavage/methylation domain-containing protein
MMFHRLGLINKKQRGFTLIELLIAIAITSLITGGITTAIFQTFTVNARTSSHMTAVRQVQNAGYWISHDAQMAQEVLIGAGAGFPLTLTWTEWVDSTENKVTYTIADGGELKRSHYENDVLTSEMIVARYIDSTKTSCQVTAGVLIVTVTAAVGDYPETVSETRVYKITPRPNI